MPTGGDGGEGEGQKAPRIVDGDDAFQQVGERPAGARLAQRVLRRRRVRGGCDRAQKQRHRRGHPQKPQPERDDRNGDEHDQDRDREDRPPMLAQGGQGE